MPGFLVIWEAVPTRQEFNEKVPGKDGCMTVAFTANTIVCHWSVCAFVKSSWHAYAHEHDDIQVINATPNGYLAFIEP